MTWNKKNRNENIDKPFWNIFWREGPAADYDKYAWASSNKEKYQIKGAIVRNVNNNKGLRITNKKTLHRKLQELRDNPKVTEIHVVYTEPQGLMVRDGDGNWMTEKMRP